MDIDLDLSGFKWDRNGKAFQPANPDLRFTNPIEAKYVPDKGEVELVDWLTFLETSNNLERSKVAKGIKLVIEKMQDLSVNKYVPADERNAMAIVLNSFEISAAEWLLDEKSDKIRWDINDSTASLTEEIQLKIRERVEFCMFNDWGARELHRKRSVRLLDKQPRPVFQETVIPGLYLLETVDDSGLEKINQTRYVDKDKLPVIDQKTTVLQEFVAKMGSEPNLNDSTGISQATVHDVEASFSTLEPRSEKFDLEMKNYFVFLSTELWTLLTTDERASVEYPCSFYDGETQSPEELKDKIMTIAVNERRSIAERGRNDNGQIGDYFWDSSKVDGLGDIKKQLDVLISLSVLRFKIDPEVFFNRTIRINAY